MLPKQRVVFLQLQLAGLGLVIFAVGLYAQANAIAFCGIGIFIFGLARTLILRCMLKNAPEVSYEDIDELKSYQEADEDDEMLQHTDNSVFHQ